MATNPFVAIQNTDAGGSIRGKLNIIGDDAEISFRIASAFAQIESELGYYSTGTTVFAKSEKKWYVYNGTIWVEETDIPTITRLLYSDLAEIDNTDSPHTVTVEKAILGDTTAGAITVTLMAIAGNSGRELSIKNIGTGTLTVETNAAETIDGSANVALAQYESIRVVAGSSGWFIM